MLLNNKIPLIWVIKKIRVELFYVLIIAILAFILTKRLEHFIPDMPIAIPAFLGTAISVILSFNLNQSYDRWWEARKVWGSIVNDSRSFILQLQLFLNSGNESQIRKIALRQMAWCYSLGQSLRGLNPTQGLERFLSSEDLAVIEGHKNKPLALLQLNTIDVKDLRDRDQMNAFSTVQVNNTLVNFSNAMGMAERIKTTIFPSTYRVYLHLIIYLFVVTLSISLSDIPSYFEIPLLITIASLFFLLEKAATHLQDPFSNLPTDTSMTAIATTIETNLRQLIGDTDLPKPAEPKGFYIM